MATIFDKGVSGDKCLILNPREALFYDFDFGTGWKEVRMGMAYSFTNSTGDNGLYTNETITNTTFNHTNNIYVGLTNSPNNTIPYDNTGIFIGTTSFTGSSVSFSSSSISNNARYGVITNQDFSGSFSNTTTLYFRFPTAVNSTGESSYLGYHSLRVNISPEVKTFSIRTSNATTFRNNASVSFLRQQMNTFGESVVPTTESTGYYASAFSPTGDLLPYPNKVLIYFPFFNNRVRIHNLLIEKYS